jgi:acetyl-CoA carboxylase carboxyltransferase component
LPDDRRPRGRRISANDWTKEIAEIQRRQELAAEMGGADRVARQKPRGKLTVRERIAAPSTAVRWR